jgi:hypothetical protein
MKFNSRQCTVCILGTLPDFMKVTKLSDRREEVRRGRIHAHLYSGDEVAKLVNRQFKILDNLVKSSCEGVIVDIREYIVDPTVLEQVLLEHMMFVSDIKITGKKEEPCLWSYNKKAEQFSLLSANKQLLT